MFILQLSFTIRRIRRDFGGPVNFSDRGPDDVKDGYIECAAYEDKSFNVKKVELDLAIQAISTYTENGTQTDWYVVSYNCKIVIVSSNMQSL